MAKEAGRAVASRAKTQFLANMSHELRTPLNAIIGFSEIMAHGDASARSARPRYKRLCRRHPRQRQHLLAIINDILDISKIEAGKVDLHRDASSSRTSLVRRRAAA